MRRVLHMGSVETLSRPHHEGVTIGTPYIGHVTISPLYHLVAPHSFRIHGAPTQKPRADHKIAEALSLNRARSPRG